MKTQTVLFSKICLLVFLFLATVNLKAEIKGDTLSRAALSFLQAPPDVSQKSLPVQKHLMATSDLGYGHNVQTGEIYQFDPAFPELPGFVAMLETPTASGDFAPDNPFTMHMIDMTENRLASMDISTGEITYSEPLGMPLEGGFWTVLAINKVSGDYYGVVANGEQSNLYSIDPLSGTSSLLMIMEIPAVISGTFDDDGILYLFDIAYDNIWQLDINTPDAVPMLLGPAGFDGDFAQGMSYCPWTNEIYLAACDIGGGASLRILDRSNGLTMLVGDLPGETTAFGFPFEIETPDPLIRAGKDEYTIPMGTLGFGEDLPPIPPDFFGPGSLPFEGTVYLEGSHSEGSQLPQADLSLFRNDDVHMPQPYPASGLSATEINQLEMRSREPMPVNVGGIDSFFDIWIELAPVSQPGAATITKTDANGGTFKMEMLLMPVITFRNVDDPTQEHVFYPMEYGYEGLYLISDDFPWMAPPIQGEFDPFGEDGLTLSTPAGNTITAVPLLRREDFAFVSMDEEGQPESWEGTGFSDSEWFYYPNYDWWNVWFYDHPLDVTRMKVVGGFIDIIPRDVTMPSYVEIILGWSTPEWPTWGGFPEDAAPPLPQDVIDPQLELQMIERTQPFFTFEGTLDETSTIEIPAEFTDKLIGLYNFNPEWIFIDIRGYNFMLSSTFWHTCFKPWPTCEVTCPPDMSVCATDDAFTLSGASPAGGTYSGSGVSGGSIFKPADASWGDNTITYSYTCPDGTVVTCTFTIHVIPPPEMVCPPDMSVCYSDWLITLSEGVPSGGSFSGPGIVGNQFKTFVAGVGTHTITYSVTDPCPGSCTFTITVHPNPEITCPDDFDMCANDPVLDLQTLVSPSGGSFMGGNTFNPSTAPPGVPLQFNYSYTDPQTNCTSNCTFYITVYANPVVTCPGDMDMCADDPLVNLQSLVSPSGGSFMGGDTFDPGTAPPGVPLQFNYTYTDPVTGCKGYCTFYITTYANPVVTCPPNNSACIDDAPFILVGATPAGGNYSGAGVAGGIFNPAVAGVGNHTITYIYTDPHGCSGSCAFTITVNDKPQVNCPPNMQRCLNDPSFALTGASPAGGNYSGAGVAGGSFSPATAGAGNHIITYTYTDPQTGCTGTCSFTITVHGLPNVTCPANISKCIDDTAFAVTGATPAGGNYAGPGIAGGNFDPGIAGLGAHNITYTYTDPQTGCTNSCSFTITVYPLPTVTCPPNKTVCDNGPAFALAGANPPGGVYSDFMGNAMVNFNPAIWGAGVYPIYYDYTDPNGCSNWCVFTITVNPSPNVTCPPNMNVCINTPAFALAGATPVGGTYAGLGVVGGMFNPGVAGLGLHTITYTYTDPANGCSNSCSFTIKVNPLPNVVCPPNMTVCDNAQAFPLAGATPVGGVYSDAIANPIANFNPAAAGLGPHNIFYDYTDPVTGCSGWCMFTITVVASPNVVCPPNMTVCDNDPAFPLAGATPAGGVYTRWAVPIANFNPATAPPGINPIVYSYTDPQTGCTGTCTFTINVLASPIVTCPPNMAVCINAAPIPLLGGAPAGGWYWKAGPGIAGGAFNPALAGVGAHLINYSYTDPATGCTGTCSFTIIVNPLPNVVCPANMTVCDNVPAFALVGAIPAGGTYFMGAAPIAIFNPAAAPLGPNVITYAYTDPNTGCTGTCTFTITVVASPVVTCPPNMNVCIDDPAFALAGGAPAGGMYSMGVANIVNFDPAAAGAGVHTIVYTYTDPNTGCSGTCMFTITVNPLPNVVCPADMNVNIFDAPFVLAGATPAGGIYLDAAGNPVVWFDPMAAGLGNHDISYEYTDQNGCSNSCIFVITVSEEGFALDLGDAPDSIPGFDYHTLLLNNGARHIIDPAVFMGDLMDAEFDGQPDINALGDDNNNLDDEDGVRIRRFMAAGSQAKISVKASVDGFLNAWIDFEQDGDWSGAGEQIFADQPLTAGWNTLTFMVPANAKKGRTYARFRFNTAGGLSYEGLAENGEVEDYRVVIFPEGWAYELTDLSHIIVIPEDLGQVLFAGESFVLEPNDMIGAFYDIRADEACGGAILYNGSANQTLMAFGNDPLTGEKDGFDEGETFGFKVYRPATGEEFDVEATFDPNMPNSDGKFHNNGMSAIAGFNLAGLSQMLTIGEGWSGVSTWLEPLDTDIENMFSSVVDEMVILFNEDGMYWPGENTNSLGQWNAHKGYFIKMADDTMLNVEGEELMDVSVNLDAGWNLVPVLSAEPFEIEMLFSTLPGFVAAKEVAGMGVYLPVYGINTIGNMMPGNAYYANTTQAGTISFASASSKATTIDALSYEPVSPWNAISHTPESHIVVFNAPEAPFMDGDIVGGFTSDGYAAGVAEISTDRAFALTLNSNDVLDAQKTGFDDGELLTYKVHRPSTGESFGLDVVYNPAMTPGSYTANGISEITGVKASALGIDNLTASQIRIYPNPSSGKFNITGEDGFAEIEVSNAYGKLILRQTQNLSRGIDLKSYPNGVYLLKIITTNGNESMHKLIVH